MLSDSSFSEGDDDSLGKQEIQEKGFINNLCYEGARPPGRSGPGISFDHASNDDCARKAWHGGGQEQTDNKEAEAEREQPGISQDGEEDDTEEETFL